MDTHVLVMGIGNVLWAEDGFGVRCVEALSRNWFFPETVKLLDGGRQGLYLLPFLEEADVLIVFDAVDFGLEPGMIKIVEGDEVPHFMGAKRSNLHQSGFQDVITSATLMGYRPEKLVLIGCQPDGQVECGGGLCETVSDQVGVATSMAINKLQTLGIEPVLGRGQNNLLTDGSIFSDIHEHAGLSVRRTGRIADDHFLRSG